MTYPRHLFGQPLISCQTQKYCSGTSHARSTSPVRSAPPLPRFTIALLPAFQVPSATDAIERAGRSSANRDNIVLFAAMAPGLAGGINSATCVHHCRSGHSGIANSYGRSACSSVRPQNDAPKSGHPLEQPTQWTQYVLSRTLIIFPTTA